MTKLHVFNYKRNRMQQIKGFYYVARHLSISEAAKAMNLTQSTVTLQIQSLERDLNFKLLNRDTKPLSLTKEGKEFYEIACPLMHEFDSVVEKFLSGKKKAKQKNINIAVHHVAISYLMPAVIAEFKKNHPDSVVTIRNISPDDALNRLKNDEIDLAFYPNVDLGPEIKGLETVSYDPMLIINKKHPLVNKEINGLKDIKGFDLIRIDQNLITLPLFEEAVKNYGLQGSVKFENGNWEMLKHFVKKNEFVAVVSAICLDKNDDDLVSKNLAKFFPKMNYLIMHKRGEILKPIVSDFMNTVQSISNRCNYSSEF